MASIDELIDLTARKKAEVERLAELERERMQLLYVDVLHCSSSSLAFNFLDDKKNHAKI